MLRTSVVRVHQFFFVGATRATFLRHKISKYVYDKISCRVQDDDEEDKSGQVMVGQAAPGTLASGNGNDNTDSQVVL